MRRMFQSLRTFLNDRQAEQSQRQAEQTPPILANFEARVELLAAHAEQATSYEDDLLAQGAQLQSDMDAMREQMESSIDAGRDRDALEFLRLAVRLRPGRDLIETELRGFRAVSDELTRRAQALFDNLDSANDLAANARLHPNAAYALDLALTRLTRYFVLLERVAYHRRASLGSRLAERLNVMIDDRKLDLELASYVLARRRALNGGESRPRLEG